MTMVVIMISIDGQRHSVSNDAFHFVFTCAYAFAIDG